MAVHRKNSDGDLACFLVFHLFDVGVVAPSLKRALLIVWSSVRPFARSFVFFPSCSVFFHLFDVDVLVAPFPNRVFLVYGCFPRKIDRETTTLLSMQRPSKSSARYKSYGRPSATTPQPPLQT